MQNKSQVAGILSIVAGVFGVLGLGWMIFAIYWVRLIFTQPFPDMPAPPFEVFPVLQFITVMYAVMDIALALLGAFAIIGGVFSLKKRRWGLALAGAIASMITFFPCGIPAVILVSMAQSEFHTQSLQ
jgi:hypothetical protein